MEGFALRPALVALALALALELAYLIYRRQFERAMERLRFQLFVVAWTLTAYFALAGGAAIPDWLPNFVAFVTAYATVDLGFHLLDRFALSRFQDSRGRVAVPQLVRDLAGWVLLAGTVLVAGARFLGWQLGSWALPSAVVSAVLGFALQDVLKNVFAGLALQLEAPFEIGDWLVVDSEPRQVLEMTWRSTLMRDNLSVLYSEPNAKLVNERIVNLGSGQPPMGFEVEVTLPIAAPPGAVKESLERAARNSPAVAESPAPVGLLVSFGERGDVYRLRFWSRQVNAVARLLDEVRTRIWYQMRRDGWNIQYPVVNLRYLATKELDAERRESSTARAAALFAQVDVLAPLPDDVRKRLAEAAHQRHFDRREKLVDEGNHGDSLFVLAEGTVLVSKLATEAGQSSVQLAKLEAGAYFGEMSLLTGAPRSASVTAETAVEVFELDRAALTPILQQDPRLAETLSGVLAERVAATAARVEGHRDEWRRRAAHEQHTLLERIRSLFGLG